MDYKQKYIKYKHKYLDLKNKLYGGSVHEIHSNYDYTLCYNVFDDTNTTKPNPTSYDTMIKLTSYDNTLFIFNDNITDYVNTNRGGKNASIRPYKEQLRCWGIPTGDGNGFQILGELYNSKTAQTYIDIAISDIKALIWKRSTTKNPVKQIIYSGYADKNINIRGVNIPYLARSIFKFSDKVNEYIIKKIYEIYQFMQNPTPENFSYLNTYEYKTAHELTQPITQPIRKPITKPINPITKPINPAESTQLNPEKLGNLIDGGTENTGSINIQLKVKEKSLLYNHIYNIYNNITGSNPKIKYMKTIHISLFTIIYYKDHPYIQSKIFEEKIEFLKNNINCLTTQINTNSKYDNIKDVLTFKSNGNFDVFGSDEYIGNHVFVEQLEGDILINNIFRLTKTNLCKFLFGDNTFYGAVDGSGNFIHLPEPKFNRDNMYYFTNESNEALYKINKKFFKFTSDDPSYKSHITITKLSYTTKYNKKDTKETIKTNIIMSIKQNKKEENFNFTDNFEFEASVK
jgi:hypothetical protein